MPYSPNTLKQIRTHLGLSQYGLAREIGVTPQTVCNWEKGTSQPSFSMTDRIYDFCHKSNFPRAPRIYKFPHEK